ncbi:hypothetical protein EELLY_v1c04330 [Entomoplasma ellychniae]|uniref:Uncharacterized protein n=1 Tax=Entomoplasma ellychniae TaxID=2114 RepID=A0A8E2QXL2_9MOLU|nr:hypothetical protein [Entomoplasma ellychniae]PPE04753.1 hypothetical protein EELLY_v1c04330 [Entomoplasma ellychniae]
MVKKIYDYVNDQYLIIKSYFLISNYDYEICDFIKKNNLITNIAQLKETIAILNKTTLVNDSSFELELNNRKLILIFLLNVLLELYTKSSFAETVNKAIYSFYITILNENKDLIVSSNKPIILVFKNLEYFEKQSLKNQCKTLKEFLNFYYKDKNFLLAFNKHINLLQIIEKIIS